MELGTEKSTIMINSTSDVSADTGMNGQMLQAVISLKYPGAILCKNGTCSAKLRIRIFSAVAAMARLTRIWRCNIISFASKFKLLSPAC